MMLFTVWRGPSAPGFPSHLRHEQTRFHHFPIYGMTGTRAITVGRASENFLRTPSSFCAGKAFFSILSRRAEVISRHAHDGDLEVRHCQSGRFLKLLAPSRHPYSQDRSRSTSKWHGYRKRATALNCHWLLVRHSPIGRAISPTCCHAITAPLAFSYHCSVMECSKAHRVGRHGDTLLSLWTKPLEAMASRETVQFTGIDCRLLILRALKSIENGMTTRSGTLSGFTGSSCPKCSSWHYHRTFALCKSRDVEDERRSSLTIVCAFRLPSIPGY
ncbi:hypothetical protein F5888DRAFT_1090670 [Russula emetica]|nr:hypothetical protein F5888DRAFT_1090670 [Russula emetica]